MLTDRQNELYAAAINRTIRFVQDNQNPNRDANIVAVRLGRLAGDIHLLSKAFDGTVE